MTTYLIDLLHSNQLFTQVDKEKRNQQSMFDFGLLCFGFMSWLSHQTLSCFVHNKGHGPTNLTQATLFIDKLILKLVGRIDFADPVPAAVNAVAYQLPSR